jgi:uncharacterized surface protein with fasciclin (FAS1) repeats
MVQVPDALDCLNLSQPDRSIIFRDETNRKAQPIDEEFGIFPMKTASKTTSKTIVNLIAAGSLLFLTSYQIWGQSAVSASSVKPTSSQKKNLTQSSPTPTPTDAVPSTPVPPAGTGGGTVPSVPATPDGSSGTTPSTDVPATAAPSPSPSPSSPAATTGDTIVGVASGNTKLKTLTAAIKAAGLEETLAGEGPFTVFAPTDKAFAALPPGTVDELLKPENKDKLAQLLTYHVVSGKLESAALKSGDVSSVLGKAIAIKVENKKVMVNEAKVTKADVPASNGVIHLIDKVILPSS